MFDNQSLCQFVRYSTECSQTKNMNVLLTIVYVVSHMKYAEIYI